MEGVAYVMREAVDVYVCVSDTVMKVFSAVALVGELFAIENLFCAMFRFFFFFFGIYLHARAVPYAISYVQELLFLATSDAIVENHISAYFFLLSQRVRLQ